MGKRPLRRKSRESQNFIKLSEPPLGDSLPIIPRLEVLCAIVLTSVIVFLHVYRASEAGALWRDEIATISAATKPSLSQLWSSLPYESFPIFPYLLLRMCMASHWLGGTDLSLRVMGALIGLGIVSVFWLNRRVLGYNVPLFSLALFGFNHIVIPWGDSIRGYGLGTILILLTYGLVWKAVQFPSPGNIARAAFVAILSVQSLYQNAFILLAICLGAVLVCIRKRLWKRAFVVISIGAAAALSLIPCLPLIKRTQELLIVAESSYSWLQLLRIFAFSLSSNVQFLLWAWIICCGICVLAVAHLIGFKRRDRDDENRVDMSIFSLTILGVGTAFILLFLKVADLPTSPWYYIVVMGPIALSVDVGIEQLASTSRRRALRLVAVLVLAGVTLPLTWAIIRQRNTSIDIIASTLAKRAAVADFIVVNPYWFGITFQRYYEGNAKWITIPPIKDLTLNRYDLLKERMSTADPLQPVFEGIEKSLRSGNRVWVIGVLRLPPEGQLPKVLPPAPSGPQGWEMGPYVDSWQEQLGYFLNSHLLEVEDVPLQITDRIKINPGLEAPFVQVGKGWR